MATTKKRRRKKTTKTNTNIKNVKEEVKASTKKKTITSTTKKKNKTKVKKQEQFVLPKKESIFVLEGFQEKKPYKEDPKKCKVKASTLKNNKKKSYNKQERKDIVCHDDYSEMINTKLKYEKDKFYLWPLIFLINRFKVMIFDMARLKKRLKYGTFKDKLLILIMILLILGCILGILFVGYVVVHAPEVSKEKLYSSSSTVLYDIYGNEFARLGAENREVISYDQLPEVLIDAIVATEDSRFFQHNGLDLARFTKAVLGQLVGHSDAGGGSTLTMQVSKLTATSTVDSGIAGIIRKFTDIYLSVFVLEKQYTKEEILEFYVNIPLLGAAHGVEQASKVYFGKSTSELTLPEAALIAGLFQAPSAYNPFSYPEKANQRKNIVLNLMERHGYITKEECEEAKKVHIKDLLVEGTSSGINRYIPFIDTVVQEVKDRTNQNPYAVSMNIYTTMDPVRQDVVNDVENGVTYKWKNDVVQAGIAVTSVKDGSIVAIGAGRNKKSASTLNYATQIKRHPGSTAKPILDYGPAIEYLGWGSSQTIIDDTYGYTVGGNIKNWDNKLKGIMTIKEALAQSRNIPALLTFQQTTNEQKKEFANNLGWYPIEDGGRILETTSIGGWDGANPLMSSAAYAAFARGGTYIEPYSFTSLEFTDTGEKYQVNPKKVQVMSEDTAYIISDILMYAVSSGNVTTGRVSGVDIAGKTGTSTVDEAQVRAKGIKGDIIGDSWTNAYSPDYSISTWYGYDNITKEYWLSNQEGGQARRDITKQLTKGIMRSYDTDKYPLVKKFKKPDTIETATIELQSDPVKLASACTPNELKETSYFKDGTAPSEESERFATLKNPSNLTATKNGDKVHLSWKKADTPNAISVDWLTKYFNDSKIYKPWAEKYLNQRIEYNNNVFGQFGYRVYKTTSMGTTEIGFTTDNSMTVTVDSGEVTYTVKSSYERFGCNQSSGITAKVSGPQESYAISFKGNSCVNYITYRNIGNSNVSSKVNITRNGSDISGDSNYGVTATAYDESGNTTQLKDDNRTYTVKFALRSKDNSILATTTIKIASTC